MLLLELEDEDELLDRELLDDREELEEEDELDDELGADELEDELLLEELLDGGGVVPGQYKPTVAPTLLLFVCGSGVGL